MILPPPAQYFPIRGNRYDVAPALRPFGTPFGNGRADLQVFQLDQKFTEYRANKLACRQCQPLKHLATGGIAPQVSAAVVRMMLQRLVEEHPEQFELTVFPDGDTRLDCLHTKDRIWFNADATLRKVSGEIQYEDALDALACQVQEDLAIVSRTTAGKDFLAGYHICAPSHWAPQEKYGLGFAAVHAPVPGIDAVNRVADAMVDAMINRGPFVRFVWGIDTDSRLNRHPEAPDGMSSSSWMSPPFDPDSDSPFVFRVERQVTWGLPNVSSALFFIRPYLTEGTRIKGDPAKRLALSLALRGMAPESRAYKGIGAYANELLKWLE